MSLLRETLRRRISPESWSRLARVWDLATWPLIRTRWNLSPRGHDSRRRLRSLAGRHTGQRCFVMGNGPSLATMDLTPLEGEYTFGLNRVYLAFDRLGFVPTYYASVNRLVLEQCADDIAAIPTTKFIAWSSRDLFSRSADVIYVPSRSRPGFGLDPAAGLWEGATVTFVAIQLAHYMGFDEVILIGVDHSFQCDRPPHSVVVSQGDDVDHFDPGYFGKGMRWQAPDLERSERAYAMARRQFERDGRRIVDATVGGKLTVFDKVPFDSLFETDR